MSAWRGPAATNRRSRTAPAGRNISSDAARRIEKAAMLEHGWMDNSHAPVDAMERQLILFWREMGERQKEKLMSDANYLRNESRPKVPSPANPFPHAKLPGEAT